MSHCGTLVLAFASLTLFMIFGSVMLPLFLKRIIRELKNSTRILDKHLAV
jgi:hypothetical protein